ncbi:MAG TPA: HNH endonuclease [Salinivirgaceae bacterium]|nr:HNH endonuclease [Salinivirgaceae bacterium]
MTTLIKKTDTSQKLKPIENEQWRFVTNTNQNYSISNYGRVMSFVHNKNGKLLKLSVGRGTKTVSLNFVDGRKTVLVHRLVAEAFLPKEQEDMDHVIHIDGNPLNNQVSNLAWVRRDECFKYVLSRLHERNRSNPRKLRVTNSKLSPNEIGMLKSLLAKGVKQKLLAKMFRISEMQVSRIKRGLNWREIPAVDSN